MARGAEADHESSVTAAASKREEILAEVDRAIEPPMSLADALEFLEGLKAVLEDVGGPASPVLDQPNPLTLNLARRDRPEEDRDAHPARRKRGTTSSAGMHSPRRNSSCPSARRALHLRRAPRGDKVGPVIRRISRNRPPWVRARSWPQPTTSPRRVRCTMLCLRTAGDQPSRGEAHADPLRGVRPALAALPGRRDRPEHAPRLPAPGDEARERSVCAGRPPLGPVPARPRRPRRLVDRIRARAAPRAQGTGQPRRCRLACRADAGLPSRRGRHDPARLGVRGALEVDREGRPRGEDAPLRGARHPARVARRPGGEDARGLHAERFSRVGPRRGLPAATPGSAWSRSRRSRLEAGDLWAKPARGQRF